MPLRDHFRPPLSDRREWGGLCCGWPAMMLVELNRHLPQKYSGGPRLFSGGSTAESDIPFYDADESDSPPLTSDSERIPTNVWQPPHPTLSVKTDFPVPFVYELRIYNHSYGRRMVAAIEIVSPPNKDRPVDRLAFVARCAALLQQRVSVTIIDIVTNHSGNLYHDLLEFIGLTDPSLGKEPPSLYAVTVRPIKQGRDWLLESWAQALTIGQSLPTMPLWPAENLAVPLHLEEIYEETCRVLRIP